MAFLKEIESLDSKKRNLKPVDTTVTTRSGKKYIEKLNDSGESVVMTTVARDGLGFCPDLTKDYGVGVALPRLLIASADVANDLSHLTTHKVTHILNTAVSLPNTYPHLFEYFNVHMYDDLDEVVMDHYPKCEEFIDKVLVGESNVILIHCNAGRSRSVSIAAAYLMRRRGLSSEEALSNIRRTRPNADPNKAFIEQLKQLEKTITSS